MLNRVRQELSSQKIEFVGIAADSAEKVRNFVETARIQYPQLVDSELAMTLSKRLGNRLGMLPHTVVIAPDGRVVLNRLGLVQETELRAIFAEKR